jgi:energy-coupling factor transporter ATP-binding protein EcfA2
VHGIILEAIQRRASDIHIEPLEKRLRVRYRIDGVLIEVENPPKRLQLSIISRLKIMANISIAEKRIPQDGRIQIGVGGKQLDLRVSSLPTAHGESIVMRILDKEGLTLGLPELGFLSDDAATFEKLITLPDGILLVTGPTGSGKTTTLYGCLHFINKPDRKIITVEDPVEYQLNGINQVPVRQPHRAASDLGRQERAGVEVAILLDLPRHQHARERLAGRQLQVGVVLVVAQQDVVFRGPLLDEVVLERQRLHHRVGDDDLEALGLVEQRVDARTGAVRAQVAADAVAEHPGLAHIERIAGVVVVDVDAGLLRQAGDLGLEITDWHAIHCPFWRVFCNLPL